MISTILKWVAVQAFSLLGYAVFALLKYGLKLLAWLSVKAWQHPRSSVALILALSAIIAAGWQTVVIVLGVAFVATSTWKAGHPASFDRYIGRFARSWWRRWFTYRRRWHKIAARSGLTVEVRDATGETAVPKITKVKSTAYWDSLRIRIEVGQQVEDFHAAAERIRHAYRALRVAVTEVDPTHVGLELMARDPFRHEIIPAAAMPATTADIDYTALPVGLTEHCQPWTVSITGAHTAVLGASGSGKASVVWNILRGVAPAIADRSVRLHFIDPKRMELRQARRIADDYETDCGDLDRDGSNGSGVLGLLNRLVEDMLVAQDRAGDLGERDHRPTVDAPLHLIIIDELAPLLAYWPRSKRDKIEEKLGLLLTQGRAVGYIVVGSTQEPTKDVFPIRDLFGRRICLRVPTESHTDASLGEDASDRGALAHRIPESLPGTAFQLLSGEAVAIRARAGNVGNSEIAELVTYVEELRSTNVVPITARRPELAAVAS